MSDCTQLHLGKLSLDCFFRQVKSEAFKKISLVSNTLYPLLSVALRLTALGKECFPRMPLNQAKKEQILIEE